MLALFDDVLSRACISTDHPRYLSFIPNAPTESASLFDLVVGASSIYGGSWLEGAGAVYAENQALRWIADLAGLPARGRRRVRPGRHARQPLGARHRAAHRPRTRADGRRTGCRRAGRSLTGSQTHSSVVHAARRHGHRRRRRTGRRALPPDRRRGCARSLEADGRRRGVRRRRSAGTTNLGLIDDLDGIADVCAEHGVWMHVDGAYGGAALAAPSVRHAVRGIERCDSFTVDPHKWLFAPFDACALLYRDPSLAKAAHTQNAGYLEVTHTEPSEWNPSDYAVHLSRRARGLPFWFSLATHGTDAYTEAIEHTLDGRAARARSRSAAAATSNSSPSRSCPSSPSARVGWTSEDYYAWSERLMSAHVAFVTPSTHEGATIARICVVNPRTTIGDVSMVLDSMA